MSDQNQNYWDSVAQVEAMEEVTLVPFLDLSKIKKGEKTLCLFLGMDKANTEKGQVDVAKLKVKGYDSVEEECITSSQVFVNFISRLAEGEFFAFIYNGKKKAEKSTREYHDFTFFK